MGYEKDINFEELRGLKDDNGISNQDTCFSIQQICFPIIHRFSIKFQLCNHVLAYHRSLINKFF